MNLHKNIKIISLGKSYDFSKIEEIMGLSRSEDIKNIDNIIIDAHDLQSINVMGTEILELKNKMSNPGKYNLVFVGLMPDIRSLFNLLDEKNKYGDLINFDSIEEAISFLNAAK